jgi:hypothetical protein
MKACRKDTAAHTPELRHLRFHLLGRDGWLLVAFVRQHTLGIALIG